MCDNENGSYAENIQHCVLITLTFIHSYYNETVLKIVDENYYSIYQKNLIDDILVEFVVGGRVQFS